VAASQVTVKGYRSLRDVRVDLGALNLIVGPNGCGKTNLYRSLYLLARAAAGQLARAMADEGGMPSALWAGPRKKGAVRTSSWAAPFPGRASTSRATTAPSSRSSSTSPVSTGLSLEPLVALVRARGRPDVIRLEKIDGETRVVD
jgi:predicted ATPase